MSTDSYVSIFAEVLSEAYKKTAFDPRFQIWTIIVFPFLFSFFFSLDSSLSIPFIFFGFLAFMYRYGKSTKATHILYSRQNKSEISGLTI